MQHLLSNYHPDLAPLAHALRAGLEASVKATPLRPAVTVPRWTTVLARVSDESRTKFLTNLDEDLDWLLDSEPAAWVKANVTDVEAFRATAAGQRARDKVGMHALYAPGTRRLIGGWLARDGWLFLFLLSSAAKSDLPQNRNAATEVIVAAPGERAQQPARRRRAAHPARPRPGPDRARRRLRLGDLRRVDPQLRPGQRVGAPVRRPMPQLEG